MPARKTVRTLSDAAADAIRRAYAGNKHAYPEAARYLVDLRERLDDWRGRGPEYREIVREVYEAAGVPADDFARLQKAIRYHISNEIHDRLSDKQLEELGLIKSTAKDRQRSDREAKSAVLAAVGVGVDDNSLRRNLPMVLAYAEALMEFAEEQSEAPKSLTPDRRVAARLALEAISKRADRLLKAIRSK